MKQKNQERYERLLEKHIECEMIAAVKLTEIMERFTFNPELRKALIAVIATLVHLTPEELMSRHPFGV